MALVKTEAQRKSKFVGHIDALLYWVLLIISILGNLMISIVLVPLLLTIQGWPLYFTIFFIATAFGYYFTFILQSIEKLRTRQHIIAMILIPALALINITIITLMSNKLILLLDLRTLFHSPCLIAGTYIIGYILPASVKHIYQKTLKKNQ